LKLLAPFASLSYEYITLFPIEKTMDFFFCKVIVLKANVFIISQRSSLDDPTALGFISAGGYLA
jgi:hypothetical protein